MVRQKYIFNKLIIFENIDWNGIFSKSSDGKRSRSLFKAHSAWEKRDDDDNSGSKI